MRFAGSVFFEGNDVLARSRRPSQHRINPPKNRGRILHHLTGTIPREGGGGTVPDDVARPYSKSVRNANACSVIRRLSCGTSRLETDYARRLSNTRADLPGGSQRICHAGIPQLSSRARWKMGQARENGARSHRPTRAESRREVAIRSQELAFGRRLLITLGLVN